MWGDQRITGVTKTGIYYRIDVYDLDHQFWLVGPTMHTPRTEVYPVRFRDKVIIIGGAKATSRTRIDSANNVEVFEVGLFNNVINEGI